MVTAIVIVVLVVVLIKFLGPVIVELFEWLVDLFMLPLAIIGGFLGFIIESLLFIGLLWLIVTVFGL